MGPLKCFLWALACLLSSASFAQKTIRVIVPFAAGGPVDLTTRWLMQEAQQSLGTPIVVENKPGAGGNIGMEAIAKALPDGLTLGVALSLIHI